jgi:hypothetical protein
LLESRQLLALIVTTVPASNIALNGATIGAEVVETAGANPDLLLYWGDEDGGRFSDSWDHVVRFGTSPVGKYSADVTDLAASTTYYYRAFALSLFAGGAVWTEAASFDTLPPAAPSVAFGQVQFVGGTTADVSGVVLSDGGEVPNVSIYFGRSDGGQDVTAWESVVDLGRQSGPFQVRLSTLLPDTSYYVRVAAANSGGRSWTAADTFRTMSTAPLSISEFMAANGTIALSRTRRTPDADFPKTLKPYDWIELQNSTDQPRDISGYHLTDDAQQPLKWAFPAGNVIPPHGYLVVYASGEDVRDPNLDEQGRLHTNFQLSSGGEYLGLSDAQGVPISHIDTDLPQFRDVSYGTFGPVLGHMRGATPGSANEPLSASVYDVQHLWVTGETGDRVRVTAHVEAGYDSLAAVQLNYRVMYDGELVLTMNDNGEAGDVAAGDGVYSADIPANVAQPGQMIRYYVTAQLSNGLVRREPLFVDPAASPEYFGTIVNDPQLQSNFPVLHRFLEEPRLVDSGRGLRTSIYYNGEFYDNAFIRIRGGTARSWPKKSYKIEFNDDHQFLLDPATPRVDEVNVNATYTDKSYLRPVLTSEFQLAAGQPSPETFHIRMHENGAFYSIAFMVEQPDRDFLRRHGLDPDGSLYKGGPGSYYTRGSQGAFEKKTRNDEDKSDLLALLTGLQLRDEQLADFLFDNVDLAAQINFMATHVIVQNIDASDKNHYLYRDTNGTGEWRMLPWDLDLVFGPDALNTDYIAADENTRGATYPNAVHPLLGSQAYPLHDGKINMLLDAIITTPQTREMFLRRVRTLADEYLATGYFHQRIDQLVELLSAEVPSDRAKWGTSAHFGGSAPAFDVVAARIKQQYLDRRLPYLTQYHVDGGVGIPQAQPDDVLLQIGAQVSFNPTSGQPGDEYFTITNPNPFAVDVSGWQIGGAMALTLKGGTVIAAGESLYLTGSAAGFRARTESPSGGESLFVQEYSTELPNTGGQLRLINRAGVTIGQVSFGVPTVPADASNLRISELNYHPRDGETKFGEMLAGGSTFEFVELTNIGPSPIELAGVRLRDGTDEPQDIVFVFASQTLPPGQSLVVVKNRAAFQSRYGTDVPVALGDDGLGGLPGEFANQLSNGGETLALEDASGTLIQQLTYDDEGEWSARADGAGSTLEWIAPGDPNAASAWRASDRFGGTPGAPNLVIPRDVVINEIRANSDAPLVDAIELFNVTDQAIDVSGWYASDSGNDPLRFQLPSGSIVPAAGFLTLSQQDFQFNLRGEIGDDAYLVAVDPLGRPQRTADYVAFGPTARNGSIGRYPDGQGQMLPLPSSSFGQANSPPVVGEPGDFNRDGTADGLDLQLLCAALHGDQTGRQYDLTGDEQLDHDDLEVMVRDILKFEFGDANLDGVFDSSDLVLAWQDGGYEDGVDGNATWSTGDWNCDGDFDSSDLVEALAAGGYERTARRVRPVLGFG